MGRLQDVILQGVRADQPLATSVTIGTLYGVTDEDNIIERTNGTTWEAYSPASGGAAITSLTGDVTGTGPGATATTIANNAVTTAKILNANVTDAKISNRTAVSVFGRSANSAGVGADIAAGANDTFLQRVGDALTWAGLTIGMIANSLITYAKIQNGTGVSVFGRAANSAGVNADIVAGADDRLLARTGAALSFVQLTVGMVPNSLITPTQLSTAAKTGSITWTIDGAGSPITTGLLGSIRIPVGITIVRWSLMADQNGDVELDIFNDAPGSTFPPTTSIVASAPPELTGGTSDFDDDTTLTGWTTSITALNCLRAQLVSTSGTIEFLTLQLDYTRN